MEFAILLLKDNCHPSFMCVRNVFPQGANNLFVPSPYMQEKYLSPGGQTQRYSQTHSLTKCFIYIDQFEFLSYDIQVLFCYTLFMLECFSNFSYFQAACCLNIWLCPSVSQLVSLVCQKKIQATSKQGMRLSFGMLIALTNIGSTKVLHHAPCIIHHASCIIGYF